jgi:hypothetical protein
MFRIDGAGFKAGEAGVWTLEDESGALVGKGGWKAV